MSHIQKPTQAIAIGLLLLSTTAGARDLDLPFQETRLANGLHVVVQEDHTLPLVAVDIVYKVGARDEEQRRTGFAHLFEHLMFMGTKRAPTKMFDQWIEQGGGSNNAWTSSDFTDYHESGPKTLLPLFLWLEADRLETLGREIDRPKLDLQRDVVKNERRQTIENVPYGKAELILPELLYPAEHPYHHPIIGSHEDLEAATVDDVRAFFAGHYLPSNASLVVAGDVDTNETVALATRTFGTLEPGRPPARLGPMALPRLGKVIRQTVTDHVDMTKIIMAFHSPAHYAPGDAELDLLSSVLSSGKSGRLYQALVYDRKLAQSVTAAQQSGTLSSTFNVEVVVRPEASAEEVEKIVDAVLDEATKKAPSDDELRRAKNEISFSFVERLQSLGERASLMNLYWAETGDPGFVKKDRARYEQATAADVLSQAQKTLTLGERVVLRLVPEPKGEGTSGKGAAPKAPPAAKASSTKTTAASPKNVPSTTQGGAR